MRHYENLVIVKPTLTEEEIKSQLAAIDEIITSNGGEIIARDEMGIKKLAYPIKKNERGYFYVVYYTMEPASIAEVERRYRINEELLRFITMKYDSKREVAAWTGMVEKAQKKAAHAAAPAPAPVSAPEAEAEVEAVPAAAAPEATEETAATTAS